MRLLLALATAVSVAAAVPGVASADVGPRVRVAQAPSRVDAATAAVARAQKALGGLAAERAAATRRYQGELAEVDQLKRQKASWRRDRALRAKLASSLETAKALTALADRVRLADADLTRAKAAAVAAIDAAMATATPSARAELAAASEQASKAAQKRLTLQTALTRRIPDLCPPDRDPKLTTRLQEWWTLPDFAAFRAEVKKVFKADIPLAERSAWEDWITRDRAEIARLSAETTKAEAQINSIVYGLFDLTPDEIALLESAA